MEKHITILGALYIAWGGLSAVFTVCIAGIVFSGDIGQIPFGISTAGCYAMTGFLAVLSVVEIAGGVALLKRQSWARILVLVLGFLNLLCIPFGTILGIYTIWVLMKDETARLLAQGLGPSLRPKSQ